jgi:hypothetical protein
VTRGDFVNPKPGVFQAFQLSRVGHCSLAPWQGRRPRVRENDRRERSDRVSSVRPARPSGEMAKARVIACLNLDALEAATGIAHHGAAIGSLRQEQRLITILVLILKCNGARALPLDQCLVPLRRS